MVVTPAPGKTRGRLLALLRCPTCRGELTRGHASMGCSRCDSTYPIVDGCPVLIRDDADWSLFHREDFVAGKVATFHKPGRLAGLKRVLPSLSQDHVSIGARERLPDLLLAESPRPLVLVIGSGLRASAAGGLLDHPSIDGVLTDVHLGADTDLVCDAHDLPFDAESFDGVVAEAVLEHVVDPRRCVEELWRVLRPGGLVWAQTPFLQAVHMGPYDVTRFTPLGHRMLFRRFDAIAHGPSSGPLQPLAWSWHYALRGLAGGKLGKNVAELVASLTAGWLIVADRRFARGPGAWDAARGSHFLGRKRDRPIPARQLLTEYRGLGRGSSYG